MKKLLFFILILLINSDLKSQIDSLRKNNLSINLFQTFVNGEFGIYYDRNINDEKSICLSYGHRFNDFGLIENPSNSRGVMYSPQTADVISLGLKKFYALHRDLNAKRYILYSLHAKRAISDRRKEYEHSGGFLNPTYIKSTYIETANYIGISLGTGFERYIKQKYVFDLSASLGLYLGVKNRQYFSKRMFDSASGQYVLKSVNTTEKISSIFPFIQIRLNFGTAF